MDKVFVTNRQVREWAKDVAVKVCDLAQTAVSPLHIAGVPRGGIPALYAVLEAYYSFDIVQRNRARGGLDLIVIDDHKNADIVIDDLIDSGSTRDKVMAQNPGCNFFTLYTKPDDRIRPQWIVFPWEGTIESSADDIFTRLLQFIGEDPKRGGLVETPGRCVKAWEEWTSGYKQSAGAVLKTFEDGGENYDELVHVKAIPFYSHCEHHLAPFFGTVAFGYIPQKRIVGLSKMNRLVEVFARRLQVQERMTRQIIDSFVEELDPLGAGCIVQARHMCMESRGVCHQGCTTTTSAFTGVIKEQHAARAEFLALTGLR